MFGKYDLPHTQAVVHIIAGLSYDLLREPNADTRSITVIEKVLTLQTSFMDNFTKVHLEISGTLIEFEGRTRHNILQALYEHFIAEGFEVESAIRYAQTYRFVFKRT